MSLVSYGKQDQYLTANSPYFVKQCHEHCRFDGKKMECTMEQRKDKLREIWKQQRLVINGGLLGLLPKDMIEYLCDMLEKKEFTTQKHWVQK